MWRVVLFFTLFSCSSIKEKQKTAWRSWEGVKVGKLSDHLYFKNLTPRKKLNEDGTEIWIYHHQTAYQSRSYCRAMGGCMGMQTYDCISRFMISDQKILDMKQSGSCPGPKIIKFHE